MKSEHDIIKNVKLGLVANDDPDISFAHCVIEVAGKMFDGHYVENFEKDTWWLSDYDYTRYDMEELKITLDGGSWNSTYEADRLLPELREKIAKQFN